MTTPIECPGCRHAETSVGVRLTLTRWLRRSRPTECGQPLVLLDEFGPFDQDCKCRDVFHTLARSPRATA